MTLFRRASKNEPFFDVDPVTGFSIEVFYADRTLETFGRGGAGWFWWPRRRGLAPEGAAIGPFPTGYSAYRNAMLCDGLGSNLGTVDPIMINKPAETASYVAFVAEREGFEPPTRFRPPGASNYKTPALVATRIAVMKSN
jgi:hypothetical protein